jgi:GH43 family beta-xylosidase
VIRFNRVALIIACLFCAADTCCRGAVADDADLLDVADLRIRDPFVVTDVPNARYIMVAHMSDRRSGTKGWQCYTSQDLRHWRAPVTVYTPPAGFWADRDFWAPEIHAYRGKFYLFGTVSAEHAKRGTQVFAADGPLGPFQARTDRAATPHDWMALDGTLHVENNHPWMVFCHEWVQISDGTMNAVRLAEDLSKPVGEPIQLFRASDAPWCRPVQPGKYVTDGPCFYRLKTGPLLMLWSSFGGRGYAVGVARSVSGTVLGPWTQDRQPLYEGGGHCMIFPSLEGRPMLVLHAPNDSPKERARFFEVHEEPDTVRLQAVVWQEDHD